MDETITIPMKQYLQLLDDSIQLNEMNESLREPFSWGDAFMCFYFVVMLVACTYLAWMGF